MVVEYLVIDTNYCMLYNIYYIYIAYAVVNLKIKIIRVHSTCYIICQLRYDINHIRDNSTVLSLYNSKVVIGTLLIIFN